MSRVALLTRTIAMLDSQRSLLGNEVVETTIAVLREQMRGLNDHTSFVQSTPAASPPVAQRKQVTILFARVTGFQKIVEDGQTFTLTNRLWQRLDAVITEQGGMIDKHLDSEVMALFGVPTAHEDDPERAIRAALALRAAFSEFVRDLKEQGVYDTVVLGVLQIQIGVNTGLVLLDGVGVRGEEYTVIGDPVNVASRVQSAAPAGGILIAHNTYLLVRDSVKVEALGPVPMKGKSDPVRVYLVLGLQSQWVRSQHGRGVEGLETEMVGRVAELRQLQVALQDVVVAHKGRFFNVIGDAGVGKTRLIFEFTQWLREEDETIPVIKGRANAQLSQVPFALMRDLLTHHFGIQDSDSASAARGKLMDGLDAYFDETDSRLQDCFQALGQLIGVGIVNDRGNPTEAPVSITPQHSFDCMAAFFREVAKQTPALVIIFEDVHWADLDSLELIHHLTQATVDVALLVICVARPQLTERPLPWQNVDEPERIVLSPLTRSESDALVRHILRKLPDVSPSLLKLIGVNAEGNPFYVEEIIKALIEDGVILASSDSWQVNLTQLTQVRIPPTLTGVLQARLDRLTTLELLTLQRAASVGRIFWEDALIFMNRQVSEPLEATETQAALRALEKRELIFQRRSSMFADTDEYIFKHALLREVAYEGVLLRQRPHYHLLVAEWLSNKNRERMAEYAVPIAEHYERAGDNEVAAELYEMAGVRARDLQNPAMATEHFSKALALIADQPQHSLWQLALQEKLGALLKKQMRFMEAMQTYLTMKFTAEMDGDLAAQAHALNGLATIAWEQSNYEAMFEAAQEAEQVAWLVGSDEESVQAMLHQSMACKAREVWQTAVATATRAYELSQQLNLWWAQTRSLQLLCELFVMTKQVELLDRWLFALRRHTTNLGVEGNIREAAASHLALAHVCRQQKQYGQAGRYLRDALQLYQSVDDQAGIIQAYWRLGEVAHLGGHAKTAVKLFSEAISLAKMTGDIYSQLHCRVKLGQTLLTLGEYETAATALHYVIEKFQASHQREPWQGLATAFYGLVEAYEEQGRVNDAQAIEDLRRTFYDS